MIPDNIQLLTDNLLLQEYTPASILVTIKGDILYITGNTGKYLEPAAGKASFNIFSMAREGLKIELPNVFHKARQNYEKVILENIKIGTKGGTKLVTITVQQIEKPLPLQGKILVIFTDVKEEIAKRASTKKGTLKNSKLQTDFEEHIQYLSEELQITREEMQTSQEELKSTNEELQSSNEELQSSNEELTTSKEEMQSLNEELHSVNAELQSKIDDVGRTKDDMNNLLNSNEIATLFLDNELQIRQFTIYATKIFKLRKSDIGRPFTDLASNLKYPTILADAKEVLRTLVTEEKTIIDKNGFYYTVRLMPYRTLDDIINGLVITFIDITTAKLLEYSLKENEALQRSLIQKVTSVIIGLSSSGKIIEFNPEAEKVFECKHSEAIHKNYFDLFIPKELREKVEQEMQHILDGYLPNKFENRVKSAKGKQLIIEWTAHKLLDEKGKLTGIITIGENITHA